MASSADCERIASLQTTMRQMRLLHAELLDQVAVLEQEQVALRIGYSSTPRLLAEVLHLTQSQATKLMLHASLVTETMTPTGHVTPAPLPNVRQALHEGALDPAHLDAITATIKQIPDWASTETRDLVEKTLADTARSENSRVVRKHGDILLDRIDQSGANPREEQRDTEPGNIFRYRRIRGGRMKFTGEVEPETAELLEALVEKLGKPETVAPGIPDPRPVEERHGDAFAEIVHRAANPRGHARAHLSVHLTLNQLLDGISGATLDSGCPLAPAAIRRLACDANLIPLVLNGESTPLDLGRGRRLVNRDQRRALVARDQGCAYPGCCTPARWADAHHVIHWQHGGKTDLQNLVLLCRKHHRILHGSEWTIRMTRGRPEFIPPTWLDPLQRPLINTIHRRQ